MSHLDKFDFRATQGKKPSLILAFFILLMIVTSLFMSVPEAHSTYSVRPIHFEEQQGMISVLDHLGETLPKQSVTLQNWMNRILENKIQLLVSDSMNEAVRIDQGKIILSASFFQDDSLTQQKNLSEAFGMKFDYAKALETALSNEN